MPIPGKGPPPVQKLRRDVRLGINLWDLERTNTYVVLPILKGRVSFDKADAVLVDKSRPDETLLPFTCPLLEAALALDVIRNDNRIEKSQVVRAYILRERVWSRLPATAVLTVLEGGRPVLNPDIFPVIEEALPLVPPKPKRVILGGGNG